MDQSVKENTENIILMVLHKKLFVSSE